MTGIYIVFPPCLTSPSCLIWKRWLWVRLNQWALTLKHAFRMHWIKRFSRWANYGKIRYIPGKGNSWKRAGIRLNWEREKYMPDISIIGSVLPSADADSASTTSSFFNPEIIFKATITFFNSLYQTHFDCLNICHQTFQKYIKIQHIHLLIN